MKYRVIKEHQPYKETILKIKKGDIVFVGEKYNENLNWNNWIKCSSQENVSGWVPEQILKIKENLATVLEDYDDKELFVHENDIVTGEGIVNGWLRCKKINENKYGWVPLENLIPINQ
ncbi:MAG: hypothetical protein JXA68_10840 [Ignavibacteriales bacterium]|nr:hypothetical protein [Ignavibacteriales bacterium]